MSSYFITIHVHFFSLLSNLLLISPQSLAVLTFYNNNFFDTWNKGSGSYMNSKLQKKTGWYLRYRPVLLNFYCCLNIVFGFQLVKQTPTTLIHYPAGRGFDFFKSFIVFQLFFNISGKFFYIYNKTCCLTNRKNI
jgi:hypothetical protein